MHNLQSSPEMFVFVRGLLRRSPALYVETYFAPSYWTRLEIWLPTILILTLGLCSRRRVSSPLCSGSWACMASNRPSAFGARLRAPSWHWRLGRRSTIVVSKLLRPRRYRTEVRRGILNKLRKVRVVLGGTVEQGQGITRSPIGSTQIESGTPC
jgi:hypothetical protein